MEEKKIKKETKTKSSQPKTEKKAKAAKSSEETNIKIPIRLFEQYKKDIIPALMKSFNYKNVMQVPKLEKIVVNMGVGAAVADSKVLDEAVKELESITGQKASIRIARKSISNFKLREGMKIGAKVTLRNERMYELLDRVINIALPRVRDF